MEQPFDIEAWSRREHLDFFRKFELPFFNVCATVDVTTLRHHCQSADRPSFFAASLYLSLVALNREEAFRLRLRDGGSRVICHEAVHASATVLLDDDSFAFSHIELAPTFDRFAANCQAGLEEARSRPVKLATTSDRDDLAYYTVLPWVTFTSFAHARRIGVDDSVPRVAFGRYRQDADGRWQMPVSIEAHHALVDGLHVGRWFQQFQQLLDDCPAELAVEL